VSRTSAVRRGQCRVIYRILDEEIVVEVVVKISHRNDVHR
jgi:mRNA-degrading endonuclease RelE of RelBE toxin-antitoxin system